MRRACCAAVWVVGTYGVSHFCCGARRDLTLESGSGSIDGTDAQQYCMARSLFHIQDVLRKSLSLLAMSSVKMQ